MHIAIGVAIGGIVGGVSAFCAGGSARDVVAATVGGAVTGGLAAATCGASLGTAVAGSAMASTIGYLTENIVAGKEATAEGIVVSAVGGAAGTMAGATLEKGISTTVSKVLPRGFGNLQKAADYGIKPYSQLRKDISGTDLQAHHIIEQRFAKELGLDKRAMLSVAVTKEEHQVFTNMWRKSFPYGEKLEKLSKERIASEAQKIYKNYPEILKAVKATLGE